MDFMKLFWLAFIDVPSPGSTQLLLGDDFGYEEIITQKRFEDRERFHFRALDNLSALLSLPFEFLTNCHMHSTKKPPPAHR
jgi:hypothetical protein